MKNETSRLLVGLLLLVLSLAAACASGMSWERHMVAGVRSYHQGRHAEAERSFQAALKEAERRGPEDPRVATTLNNLAVLYKAQGQYAQAEPLYQRALAIKGKVLGPEHPSLATSLNNLAGLYVAQGEYARAEPLYKRALAIVESTLGPEHPRVAATLMNYATLLRATNREAEAAELEARAEAIRAKHAQENPTK
ncbi:MAG: tetratricopeptide repeat protein [Candidatus Methylomirabilia bacterium]